MMVHGNGNLKSTAHSSGVLDESIIKLELEFHQGMILQGYIQPSVPSSNSMANHNQNPFFVGPEPVSFVLYGKITLLPFLPILLLKVVTLTVSVPHLAVISNITATVSRCVIVFVPLLILLNCSAFAVIPPLHHT